MRIIGLALRLPFYVVLTILTTATWGALALGCAVLWYAVLPPLWVVVVVPLEFLATAFQNGTFREFRHGLRAEVGGWWSGPEFFREVARVYSRNRRWFATGSRLG